jgi:hypothetical protein
MNELRIPTLPDGVEFKMVGEEGRIYRANAPSKNYAWIQKKEVGRWEIAKWVPKTKKHPYKGEYEIVGEYESAQAALDVAAALLFLGEIDYGYD